MRIAHMRAAAENACAESIACARQLAPQLTWVNECVPGLYKVWVRVRVGRGTAKFAPDV